LALQGNLVLPLLEETVIFVFLASMQVAKEPLLCLIIVPRSQETDAKAGLGTANPIVNSPNERLKTKDNLEDFGITNN
jgi:hypothetical protein